jgi:UDP-N-acetylglucosamine acyltransferase
MVGGVSGVERDVIPYGSVLGDRARLTGLNLVGMQRRGFSRDDIQALRTAYQMLFDGENGTLAERRDAVARRFPDVRPVREVLDFIGAESSRGLCQPKANGG